MVSLCTRAPPLFDDGGRLIGDSGTSVVAVTAFGIECVRPVRRRRRRRGGLIFFALSHESMEDSSLWEGGEGVSIILSSGSRSCSRLEEFPMTSKLCGYSKRKICGGTSPCSRYRITKVHAFRDI
jgi:hypothetical protein